MIESAQYVMQVKDHRDALGIRFGCIRTDGRRYSTVNFQGVGSDGCTSIRQKNWSNPSWFTESAGGLSRTLVGILRRLYTRGIVCESLQYAYCF